MARTARAVQSLRLPSCAQTTVWTGTPWVLHRSGLCQSYSPKRVYSGNTCVHHSLDTLKKANHDVDDLLPLVHTSPSSCNVDWSHRDPIAAHNEVLKPLQFSPCKRQVGLCVVTYLHGLRVRSNTAVPLTGHGDNRIARFLLVACTPLAYLTCDPKRLIHRAVVTSFCRKSLCQTLASTHGCDCFNLVPVRVILQA